MAIGYTIGIEKIALSKKGDLKVWCKTQRSLFLAFQMLKEGWEMAGLNICPYCGSPEVHVSEWFDSDSGEPSYYVACDKCGYEAETKQPTYEEAVDHWNRRASFDIHNADEGEKGLYSDPI